MQIEITNINETKIAEIVAEGTVVHTVQNALDLLANCAYQGAEKIIIHEQQLTAAFFDLKTGLAGDILQKFSNYNMPLAIVGDFSKHQSRSLRDFIYESNKTGRINFVSTVAEAREKLSGK